MDNQTMMQYFEWNLPRDGLLWERVNAKAEALKKSGIDIIWLPPAYKGAAGASDVGYGVYDTYDLGEFDQKGSVETKYGSRKEYLAAIRSLQKQNMVVLVDIVLNHRIGADETELVEAEKFDPNNRLEQISGEQQIKAWTKYTFPGRKGKYSDFTWDWTCFSGIDWDDQARESGIFRFAGKEWSPDVGCENGNYDYLMGADVDVSNPKVVEELERWGSWYLKTTGADGFRLDAIKHMDHQFYENWLAYMRKESGKELFAVGEYWSKDLNELTAYLQNIGGSMSLFDIPLHMNFYAAASGNSGFDMSKLFENTLVHTDSMHTVTFVDNHDTQPGQSLESWVQEWFKPLAYAAILLRRDGLPCIYYADYYGLRGDGIAAVPNLRRMLMVRRRYAYGEQHDYFDNSSIVGWTREGDEAHPHSGCAVLMSDSDGGEKTMYIGKQHAGKVFRDVCRLQMEYITVQENGNATFKTPGGGVSVWIDNDSFRDMVIHLD